MDPIQRALRAELRKPHQITLFIPDKKRNRRIPRRVWRRWQKQAIMLLTQLFGGQTGVDAKGGWYNSEKGRVEYERTFVAVSYSSHLNANHLRQLRLFLHRFGREMDQGEVGIVIDTIYYGITQYDQP